jgi:hypothetical protein
MKIAINKMGNLEIDRAGKWVRQKCMRAFEDSWCGDHCPLFGEPELNDVSKGYDTVVLCERTLCGTIEDMRGKA